MQRATRSAAKALPVAPRSRAAPRGTVTVVSVTTTCCQRAAAHRQGCRGRVVGGHEGEGAVVARRREHVTEQRVDEAVGLVGGLQGHPHRPDEHGGDLHGVAGGAVGEHQVAVVAEPAAGQVDLVEHPGRQVGGGLDGLRGGAQLHVGAERSPRRGAALDVDRRGGRRLVGQGGHGGGAVTSRCSAAAAGAGAPAGSWSCCRSSTSAPRTTS